MEEAVIHETLQQLGIQEQNWRSVLLLPLVQVAWADDAIQAGERARLRRITQDLDLDPSLLDRWLTQRPSDSELELARRLIVELAYRQRGLGAALEPRILDTLEALCHQVAEAAGGLFGVAFTVSPEERAVIQSISDDLHQASAAFLEQLPTPETGRFTDL